ncbi:hypothetical protein [Mycetocola zhujimingii]|uniref:Asp/Glu/hydantoin racemase n=1 Tax=Mycetocola zhujimingii TaxID=2079792 RepID=A0A2U1TB73_9MICO|nr:hypothetical protein [Mycetocola zhujimingii]PWC06033.1 hypothetical protein DF223_13435 [Mycetocola zhujimingii]
MTTQSSQRVGLLHTVPALAESFSSALHEAHPTVESVHIVDTGLLDPDPAGGVTQETTDRVAAHIRHLEESGALAILVTCASTAEIAEQVDSTVPVVRVDEAMAEQAVTIATEAARREDRTGHVEVLVTRPSTVGPTGRLLERFAAAHPDLTVDVTVVDGAEDAREQGDIAGHDALIRDAAIEFAARADVLVLAQASMAEALHGVELPTRVLTSPNGGVRALLAALRMHGSPTHAAAPPDA